MPRRVLWHWGQLASTPSGFRAGNARAAYQAQYLDPGGSSAVEEVVGRGSLARAKNLAKDCLDNWTVQILMFGYLGINIPRQCLVYYYRKSLVCLWIRNRKKNQNTLEVPAQKASQILSCSLCTMLNTNNIINFLCPFMPISPPDY